MRALKIFTLLETKRRRLASPNIVRRRLTRPGAPRAASFLQNHGFQFLRGPAGGVDFEKSCFSYFKASAEGKALLI